LKLEKLTVIYFLSTEHANMLVLKCEDESIIYQTYQDKNGDIDEVINSLRIPLKNLKI
jgi:hypothetical protein